MDAANPLGVFGAAFAVSAFAGLAALLRSGTKITWVSLLTASLNSGLLGLGISLLWYTQYLDNVYFLVGVCLLAGLGGMTTIEFLLAVIRKGGFTIKLPGGDKKIEDGDANAKS